MPFSKGGPAGELPAGSGAKPHPPVGRKCAFDGSAVKSAFALLLEKVTKPAADAAKGRIDLYGLGLGGITV